jgi:hypothetical protein
MLEFSQGEGNVENRLAASMPGPLNRDGACNALAKIEGQALSEANSRLYQGWLPLRLRNPARLPQGY